jgi:outer membrane protein assembly factor BamB
MKSSWKFVAIAWFALTLAACHDHCPGRLATKVDANPDAPVPKFVGAKSTAKTDAPLFGGTPSRNMVNLVDKNVPTDWNVEEGKRKNIKWAAELGDKSYGGPVVANGKVYVGTNNRRPRDPNLKGSKAILMCFNEADGKFLWQVAHEIPTDVTSSDALHEGLCSTPVVENDIAYYVTPGCEVVATDSNGKQKWSYNLNKEHKVFPYHLANCSPLIAGDLVMVVTGNGTDEEGKIHSPEAPSFIAINKKTGKHAWSSNLPGKRIIEGQFSNPTVAVVNGKQQVIFPGGDSVLYSFDAETGNLVWKCDCVPVRVKPGSRAIDIYFVATPVVVNDRLYIGMGVAPMNAHTPPHSYFLCLDVTRKGDVSFKSYSAKDAANKNSALVWAFGGPFDPAPAKGRQVKFGVTLSTAAVHDGFVYVAEESGYMHCLDAKTGDRLWEHDFRASVWGSPYYVDGKVYIGTEDGEIIIFQHGKDKKVINTVSVESAVHTTPVVANGVLYVQTRSTLYAIANGK